MVVDGCAPAGRHRIRCRLVCNVWTITIGLAWQPSRVAFGVRGGVVKKKPDEKQPSLRREIWAGKKGRWMTIRAIVASVLTSPLFMRLLTGSDYFALLDDKNNIMQIDKIFWVEIAT